MLTPKAPYLLALAGSIAILALAANRFELLFLTLPITITFLISSLSGSLTLPELKVKRCFKARVLTEREGVEVTLEVRHLGDKGLPYLTIKEELPPYAKLVEGLTAVSVSLEPGEEVKISYRLAPLPRGHHPIGPLMVTVKDAFGLRAVEGHLGDQETIAVLPTAEPMGAFELRSKRVGVWPGAVRSRMAGLGGEFYGLRQYRPGDELRRINWKATARLARLVSNEFEKELVTDIAVILDCTEDSVSKLFPFSFLEYSVRLAASLAYMLMRQGNRVSLLTYGGLRTWVPPGFGRRHFLRMLNELADVRAGRPTLPLGYVVRHISSLIFPPRGQVVLISPMLGDEFVSLAGEFSARRYSVIVLTARAQTLEAKALDEAEGVALRLMALIRDNNLSMARRFATVIELSPEKPLKALARELRWLRLMKVI